MKAPFAACGLLAAGTALAAGGHFDVDDATLLDRGQCQVETWAFSGRAPSLSAQHLAPTCNLGGLEWGLNLDRVRQDGLRANSLGPQLKWVADPAARHLGLGLSTSLTWRDNGPRRPLASLVLPATLWLGAERQWQLNANIGHDHDPVDGHFRRWGAGVDWTLTERWLLTVERRSQFGQALTRAGLRCSFSPKLSADVSTARGGETRLLALGLNWVWER